MLTDQQIEANKIEFLDILSTINREGFKKDELIDKLLKTDFFEAPASTIYHNNYKGGLVEHCLNVYKTAVKLATSFCEENLSTETNFIIKGKPIDLNSIKIVALMHDISKFNYYELFFKNTKQYKPDGKKYDNGGNYDWVTEESYKVKSSKGRFLYSTHGHNSEYITNKFIPLTFEGSVAIVNHMGVCDEVDIRDLSAIYDRFPLASLLHMADFSSTYILENIQE